MKKSEESYPTAMSVKVRWFKSVEAILNEMPIPTRATKETIYYLLYEWLSDSLRFYTRNVRTAYMHTHICIYVSVLNILKYNFWSLNMLTELSNSWMFWLLIITYSYGSKWQTICKSIFSWFVILRFFLFFAIRNLAFVHNEKMSCSRVGFKA